MPECLHSHFTRLEREKQDAEDYVRIQCDECKDIFVVTLKAFEIEVHFGKPK
jgi:hypothetical protein